MYNPQNISQYFDQFGAKEWERLARGPLDEINLTIHTHYLRTYVPAGARVLEIGAGAGRFTQALAEIGARIQVADISPVQLALNRQFAAQYGFEKAVEDWQEVDICDLSLYAAHSFDVVVVYGGPFSYVLEQRDQALAECLRVLKPGGRLLGSVMSLWGSCHRALFGVVMTVPPEFNQRITATGDLTPATYPERQGHYMHMFRAGELNDWLCRAGMRVLALSASGVLANAELTQEYEAALRTIRTDEAKWAELLRMEIEASAQAGCLDMGTFLIFVGERS